MSEPRPCPHALAALAVPARKWATRAELTAMLARAEAYLQTCPVDEFKLSQVASEAGISQHHFLRLFREVYRETPYRYLIRTRIEAAKAELRATNKTVGEIGAEAGFTSFSAFTRAFKKETGKTPTAYRKCN